MRLPKENFDVFRVMQSEDPAVMLVGHWSYPKLTKGTYMYPVKKYNGHFMEETGEMAQRDPLHKTVYAIGSVHCASVELIVNGKSKGVVRKPDHAFVYAFPNVDITESGTAEVVARDKAGKEIARHVVRSFVGDGALEAKVMTGPKGWLADGSDIAVVDFSLVDANPRTTSHKPRITHVHGRMELRRIRRGVTDRQGLRQPRMWNGARVREGRPSAREGDAQVALCKRTMGRCPIGVESRRNEGRPLQVEDGGS